MRTYYCDGSQCDKKQIIGIGICGSKHSHSITLTEVEWNLQLHEIEAMIKTIEIALENGANKIRIINDDRQLVHTIKKFKKGEKTKSKGLIRKERFRYLLELIKTHDIKVGTPKTDLDKENIKMCHNLSRMYLSKTELEELFS